MKKVLSLILSVVMLVSMFSVVGVVAGATAKDAFEIVNAGIKNGVVTFNIFLNKNVSTNGVIMRAEFNPDSLEPVITNSESEGAFLVTDSYGDLMPAISGMYVFGLLDDRDDVVSMAFTPMDAYESSVKKGLFSISFKVIDPERAYTSVSFKCTEFNSEDENYSLPINNDNPLLIQKIGFSTMDAVTIKSVASLEKGLRVTWNAVKGAEEYRVYKNVDGSFKAVTTTSKLSYDDTTVGTGKSATYMVRAINYTGENGAEVLSVKGKTVSGTHVVAPGTVETAVQANGVKVSWTKASTATQYRIYRREIKADGSKTSWKFLMNISKANNNYVDDNAVSGKHYEYTVRTVVGDNLSAVCRFSDVWFYKAPTTTVKSAVGGVKVSWTSVGGAESYKVYRRYDAKGSWKQIANVGSGATSYTDGSATSGRVIEYAVRAFAKNGSSKYVAKKLTYVATPTLKSISNTVNGVNVKWSKVTGATEYKVFRKAGNGKSWQSVATVKTTYYNDKNVKSGTYYTYTVRAVKNGVTSGYDAAGIKVKFLAAPKLTNAVNVSAGIKVTFGTVSGAASYNVYRKVGTGAWKLVGNVKTGAFTDKNVKNGTTYKYTVRAVSGKTLSGFNSSGVSVKCK